MDLSTMRGLVRRDVKDEDAGTYRWTNDEVDRAIQRALSELDKYAPQEMQTELATVDSDTDVDISSLTGRIAVDKVEFPIDERPRQFVRFSEYGDTLSFEEAGVEGDGENCRIYWSKVHVLDVVGSTIPTHLETLVALGATAYLVLAQSQYQSDRANIGGEQVDRDYSFWGRDRLKLFKDGLKKASRNNKVRTSTLYVD